MAEDFAKAVDDGLKLSKRIYFGKDRAVAPPRPLPQMEKSSAHDYLPTAPMVYAVISDPGIVDNPDIPSYQPHVHGRCDPPALIPLQMNGIELVVNCYLDTAFVRVIGSWRVHCVMGSRSCDCRVAVPMGDQGSILGVEVDVPRKSYYTELIAVQDNKHVERVARDEDGGFLKPHIFTLTIPQIDGGTNLSIRLSWSQKLSYKDGQFSVNVPFRFPEYVTPAVKKISKKEKIQLNVDAGTGTEVLCKTSSHPLKEIRRHVGKLGFLYEAEVLAWSNSDFNFSYTVSSTDVFGGLLLQSPSIHDVDQRETFCIYLMPGSQENRKVFRKEVIFVVDISGSMNGKPLEDMKSALSAALFGLSSEDLFNIMAFNGETYLFSTSMELATNEAVDRANEWISINFIAEGGTNILPPLDKAVEMLSNTRGSVPMIFLVTDGAVEDERHICDVMKSRLTNGGSICPRIYTFGIGSFCNNYFLQTLATISGGHHEAAYDVGTIEIQLQRLFTRALCTVLTNITIHGFEDLNKVEVYPSRIPDLSSVSPLIVSGCYQGKFPDNLTVKGLKGDLTNCIVDLKIQSAKDIPIDRVLAKQKIDLLTAQAWFSDDKQLQEKVAKISIQTGFPSEYTTMALLEEVKVRKATEPAGAKRMSNKSDPEKVVELKNLRKILLYSLGIGFGDITATTENIPPGYGEAKLPDAAEMFIKAASNCCGRMCSHCCCMCCIQCCTKINDQCAIAFTQLCAALACFGCAECCSAICCPGEDGH
ncbi:inter-alpha-trypsin inhibitor heavy chain H3 isoform X2 [Carica papaya]|uniref:inter-alpha-trypsin inhibitor heavy chain H3 isoform X2 n=1 Tax=Carica papaya TaxID=3649 RepID=UPI000B8D153D|nr:inter-alpha-trypsin inhibitor heavy chain H3 isoform X2 [Carica papaya]